MSFLFPKVVECRLHSRFSSQNTTSVLRTNSADPSLSWKQDGDGSCIAEMFPPSWHGPRSKGQAVPAPFQPAGHLCWELFALDCGTSSCQRDIPLPQLDRHKGSHRHPRDKLCSAVSAHHRCCAEWEKYSHSVWKTAQSSHGDTFHRNT